MTRPYFSLPKRQRSHPLALSMSVLLVACGSGVPTTQNEEKNASSQTSPLEGLVTVDRLPMPTDATLLKGRDVWSDTCQGCHGLGIAGSPKITDKAAWEPRIAKGRETLRQHALEGFFGDDGAMMPERGGNPDLSDDQVMAAVDFMIANSQ